MSIRIEQETTDILKKKIEIVKSKRVRIFSIIATVKEKECQFFV